MVNPQLLWFLPLVLIPVVLHLITLRSLRTVELSTFRFLMESYVQQRRRARFLEFLVMLLRLVFVGLIVLVLSRPVVQHFSFLGIGGGGKDVSLVMDASASMAIRSRGTTSLQRAGEAAKTIVNMLRPEDHLKLIRAGKKPVVLVEGFVQEPETIIERLSDITVDAGSADLAGAFQEIFSTKPHGRRVIYLLTDGLQSAWSGLANHPVLQKLDAQTSVVVLNVGSGETMENVAIAGEPPQEERVIQGLPVLLNATVVNSSADRSSETVLSVLLDDELARQINLTLQPKQRITQSISIIPNHSGMIRGQFQLPGDAFPEDDTFLFCLNVAEKLDVLLVTGPVGESRAGSAEVYVKAALTSPQNVSSTLNLEESRLAAAIQVVTIPFDQLTEALLNTSDVVIAADVPLDAARGILLQRYVESGSGLFILPGVHTNPEDYNQYLLAAATSQLRLAPPVGDEQNESGFQSVGNIDLAHPVLSAFAEKEADYFSTVKFYRYFPLEIKQEASKEQAGTVSPSTVLMRLGDRTAILAEVSFGDGKILVSGFAATAGWSNLPLKPEFVPIILRSIAYLQKPADASVITAVAPSQPAPIRLTDRWPEARVQVSDPGGKGHKIDLHRNGRSLVGAMLQTGQKGFYTCQIFPRAEGAVESLELGFAVNLTDKKADFSMMSESQIRQILTGVPELAYLRSMPEDTTLSEQLTYKREIWRTLIWLCFVIIGAEFLMSTLRPRREPVPLAAGAKSFPAEAHPVKRWFRYVLALMGMAEYQVPPSIKGI